MVALALTACDSTVAPFVPVATTIDLSLDSVAFSSLGQVRVVAATVRDQNGDAMGEVTPLWSSDDAAVVTVSGAGVLTAVGNGDAIITVTAGDAMAALDVSVTQAAATLLLLPDSIVLPDPGDTASVSASVLDTLGSAIADPTVAWASSDEAVAIVDADGLVTAVATGTVSITAQVGDANAAIAVRVEPELSLEAASPTHFSAEVATGVALSVLVEDLLGAGYAGATVSWEVASGGGQITSAAESTSDNTGHAGAVWTLGTVAGAQEASATIVTRGIAIVVTFSATALAAPAAAAYLTADSVLLSGRGESALLTPTFEDPYGNVALPVPVSWDTSDAAVATVGSDGLVTGQSTGSSWVTATLGSSVDSIQVTLAPRGAITITFDDGWLTTYTEAWPVLQEFNLVGNVGVYTEAVGWPGYMDVSQLQELHDDGWTMVSHSISHDSLTTLSDELLDYELRNSQQWLIDRGFERGAKIFIAPYHDFGLRERVAVSNYYDAARGVSSNAFIPDSLVFWKPSDSYELTGIDVEQLPYTTVLGRDQLRTLLQRTLDEGRFIDVLFHQVPSPNVTALRETLMIVDEFRDRVLTYHELYPELPRIVR